MAYALTTTDVGNLALSKVRTGKVIVDLATDTSTEARELRRWFDVARRQALADFDWSFAHKRATLAAHADAAPVDWVYRYVVPADLLVARYLISPLGPTEDAVPFALEESTAGTMCLLTDLESAVLAYTYDVETTTRWSPTFVPALATLLGHYVAGPLTGKATITDRLLQEYRALILLAGAHNMNQAISRAPREAVWIRDR